MSFLKKMDGSTSIHRPSFLPMVANFSSFFLLISRVTLANSSIWCSTTETLRNCVRSRPVDGRLLKFLLGTKPLRQCKFKIRPIFINIINYIFYVLTGISWELLRTSQRNDTYTKSAHVRSVPQSIASLVAHWTVTARNVLITASISAPIRPTTSMDVMDQTPLDRSSNELWYFADLKNRKCIVITLFFNCRMIKKYL